MKRPPNISATIRAECDLYPSEDSEKVMRAVKNVVRNSEPAVQDRKIASISKHPLALSKIHEQARSRAIMGVLRRVLEHNRIANSTWLLLNKQAAFAGVVSICEDEAESPLGPIKITITSNRLDAIVDWLLT